MHKPFLATMVALVLPAFAFNAPASARGFEVASAADVLSTPIGVVEVIVADEAVGPQRQVGASRHGAPDTIGESDVDDVVREVSRTVEKRLTRAGVLDADADDAARLVITVTKARASNLQFTEYGRVNNLRGGSVAAGGGEFDIALVSADGATLGEYHYDYFEPSLDRFIPPVGAWTDLRRAAGWLGGHLADEFDQPAVTN